jgi:hypothetical protein
MKVHMKFLKDDTREGKQKAEEYVYASADKAVVTDGGIL